MLLAVVLVVLEFAYSTSSKAFRKMIYSFFRYVIQVNLFL